MLTTITRPDRYVRIRSAAPTLDQRTCIAPFPTELNWMAIAWRDDVLDRQCVRLCRRGGRPSWRSRGFPACHNHSAASTRRVKAGDAPAWIAELDRQAAPLRRRASPSISPMCRCPGPPDAVRPARGRRLPADSRGLTRTYGELAAECGSPGAARAVGSVMAKNRYPLIVPCHRVLAAGGELGGYSAPDGLKMKRRLLEMER